MSGVKVHIIGVGPGAKDYIIPIARRRIEEADCLVGAKRLIGLFGYLNKENVPISGHFDAALSYIKKYKNKKKIAVLVSGDPGIYSFLGRVSGILKPGEYSVIPGISSLQLAFAKIGRSWQDAKIMSLHGRKRSRLTSEVKLSDKVFLFTDPSFPPERIAAHLLKEGLENRRAVVLKDLSYPGEKIIDTDLKRLSRMNPAHSKNRVGNKRMGGAGLCAVIIEKIERRPLKGKLYGIGIGPGDPGLITLKAKEILDRVDTIFVPKGSEDGRSLARTIVEAVTNKEKNFVELTFPMTKNKSILNRYWLKAAGMISKEINKSREASFVTLGDPSIYSTYAYLVKTIKRHFPGIAVETIPGISAFNAAASAAALTLVEGSEKLAIVPVGEDLRDLERPLKDFDTVVLMKVGSKLGKIISLLNKLRLLKYSVLISRVGHEDEKIIRDLRNLRDKKAGYLSVIIVKKGRAA